MFRSAKSQSQPPKSKDRKVTASAATARPQPLRHQDLPAQLQQVNLRAAGIDIGSESHWVAVPPDTAAQPVREFDAFTGDLERLADWLQHCGVTTVVMESTGVYWIPLFELLETRGLEVLLVDPRKLKSVPGRKTDVVDCQWLQQLHTFGLLVPAFRPADRIVVLRSYLRHRAMLVEYAAQHVQHMQKALQQMNVRLEKVPRRRRDRRGIVFERFSITSYSERDHEWECEEAVDQRI